MRKILCFISVCVTALALGACGNAGPEETAKTFTKAVYTNDVDTAAELICIRETDPPGSKDMVRGKLTQHLASEQRKVEKKGGIEEIVVEKMEVAPDGNNAKGKVKITYKKSEKADTDPIELSKLNGKWCIEP